MKLETAVIITKGACLTAIPFFTILGQIVEKMATPPQVYGIPVSGILAAAVAGLSGLLAFISTSFGNYLTSRTNGNAIVPTTTTNTPTAP